MQCNHHTANSHILTLHLFKLTMTASGWQQVWHDCVNQRHPRVPTITMSTSPSPSLSHVATCCVLCSSRLYLSLLLCIISVPCPCLLALPTRMLCGAVAVVGCVRLSTDIRECQNTFSGSCSVVLHFLQIQRYAMRTHFYNFYFLFVYDFYI